ncbi:MAG: radical SAM protein [Spirochaetales bacterium]|nr:radical SAM protein [Spirochaetales bacterium]
MSKIYIDRRLTETPLVANISERAGNTPLVFTDDPEGVLRHYRENSAATQKDILIVRHFPGRFLSACPGSDGMVCCNYAVFNLGYGCLFDCHYCYLQQFLNSPVQTLYGNLDDLFAELDFKTRNPRVHFRIGTGEYTDSLALDPLTGLSRFLVNYFASLPNATLELKTKSSNVELLLDLDHRGHTVVAWSINPESVIENLEPGTASLSERLAAACKVVEAGYQVALHLDPLIYFEGWEKEYHNLLDQVFDAISPDRVRWISLGTYRYAPGLKEKVQARGPDRMLTGPEMVQAKDGKYRYLKTIRSQMYVSVRKKIETIDPALFSYLCMETRRTWQDVVGSVPDSKKNLDLLFEDRRRALASADSSSGSGRVTPA